MDEIRFFTVRIKGLWGLYGAVRDRSERSDEKNWVVERENAPNA